MAATLDPEELKNGFKAVWNGTTPQDLSTFMKTPPDTPKNHITPQTVMNQLEKLNTKKAPGPDGISAKILYGSPSAS
jgi:hypothetical protein